MSTSPTRRVQTDLRPYFRDIEATPLLTAREERELARRIAEGDREARDHLVRANLRLVVALAGKFATPALPLEDLVAEGNLGLIRAAESFDGERGVRFSTYAGLWIRQAMGTALIRQGSTVRLPSHARRLLHRWRRTAAALAEELGREPSEQEIAAALCLTNKNLAIVREALAVAEGFGPPQLGEGDPVHVDAIADDRASDPAEWLGEAEERERLEEGLGRLEERSARLLRLRFGLDDAGPRTLKKVGAELGMSREWVRKVEKEALERLRTVG